MALLTASIEAFWFMKVISNLAKCSLTDTHTNNTPTYTHHIHINTHTPGGN